MAINWESFQGELDSLIDEAGDRTDKKLANKISSITRLTDDEVKKLFPDSADIKKLAELMEIVKRAGDKNEKITDIVTNVLVGRICFLIFSGR
jgi:hypothetical protein